MRRKRSSTRAAAAISIYVAVVLSGLFLLAAVAPDRSAAGIETAPSATGTVASNADDTPSR